MPLIAQPPPNLQLDRARPRVPNELVSSAEPPVRADITREPPWERPQALGPSPSWRARAGPSHRTQWSIQCFSYCWASMCLATPWAAIRVVAHHRGRGHRGQPPVHPTASSKWRTRVFNTQTRNRAPHLGCGRGRSGRGHRERSALRLHVPQRTADFGNKDSASEGRLIPSSQCGLHRLRHACRSAVGRVIVIPAVCPAWSRPQVMPLLAYAFSGGPWQLPGPRIGGPGVSGLPVVHSASGPAAGLCAPRPRPAAPCRESSLAACLASGLPQLGCWHHAPCC